MSSRINLDLERENRLGFPEAIFGENKDINSLLEIVGICKNHNNRVLITRLQKDKFEELEKKFSDLFYDEISGICVSGNLDENGSDESVGIISAGTTDAYVVNEAYYTLKFQGIKTERIQDVGVAGIHRLMNRLDDIKKYKVLIVVAGFEGALPTVVGGLLPQPIIAVPTSIGYGVASDGKVALYSMLSSCANGITVVNIDNGYGSALAAIRILNSIKVTK
ncbi:nickel pincer cofactor biosynthesis protein LarB [Bacteroidota bacterium]